MTTNRTSTQARRRRHSGADVALVRPSTPAMRGAPPMMRRLLAATALSAPLWAHAAQADVLVELINAYRAAPGACRGRPATAAPPLVQQAALARVPVTSGTFLEPALERAGFPVARADAIEVSGPPDAHALLTVLQRQYCETLLRPEFSSIGVRQDGARWLLMLTEPLPPVVPLPDWPEAGASLLRAVNAARASARLCGARLYPPAPALAWNAALGQAARAHSLDMARQRYFSHQGKDGRMVGERAAQAGYQWRRIGENIAAGQASPDQAMAAWLDSPGHCANLMAPEYTEMGAAYGHAGADQAGRPGRVYWTQVFGAPR